MVQLSRPSSPSPQQENQPRSQESIARVATKTQSMGTSLLVAVAVYAHVTPIAVATVFPWHPIPNITDPHIQELGRWAVQEHVRQANDGLTFKSIVSGEYESIGIAGDESSYLLTIDAVNRDGMDSDYVAAVKEIIWMYRYLLSFHVKK
jgi:hypothetical protein